ncbi:MAG: TonB-dependent receptor plug domain-containing protein [Chthoniobacterales bacterium]
MKTKALRKNGWSRTIPALSAAFLLVLASASAWAQDAVQRPSAPESSAAAAATAPRPAGPLPIAPAPAAVPANLAQAEAAKRNADGTLTDGTGATADRVIVTGSNIPTADEVGANPVLTYDRTSIAKSGERTAEEFLRNLPVANANGVPVSNNENGSNTAVGAAAIALRGFDSRATLVLLDGRRVAPYPVGNNPGSVNAMFVDLNSIPQAAIESIEILKDGASTTYGADAVAGVVNLKMRHYFDGAEVKVEYGNTTDKDSGVLSASLTYGVGNGTTEVSGTLNYYHRNAIANRDRSYSAIPPFLSSNASPYNLQLSNAAVAEAGGTVVPSDNGTQFATAPDFTNGSAPASGFLYSGSRIRAGANGFNFNEFSLSFPSTERYGGYTHFEHKFFGDQVVVYGDVLYQNVQSHNELAPPATGSFQTAGQVTLAIPPREANLAGTTPFGGPTYTETGVTPGAFNPFNPFNQIISGGSRARLAEFGNRKFDNETDAFLTTVGVKGDKLFDGTWGYDAGFRYSQVKNVQTGTQVSISRFNRILNQADPIFDPNSSEYIGTTVAFNPFGDFRVPIPSNAASVAFATVHPKDEDTSKLATLDANLYTTSLFELPAGGVGLAFGGQFRKESLDQNPDALNVAGDISGNSPVPTANGGRRSYAFYAETDVPIFSPQNAIPGFHSLNITGSGRYEAFRNNNTDVLVPKVGVRWQPFDDQLTLRATWGEGFREPSLEELYSAPISGLKLSHDPMNGGAFEPETNVLIVSNPNLQPEESSSYNFGVVYSPKYVPGLTFSVDAWGIDRDKVIGSSPADEVLARELTGMLLNGESVERDAGGGITRIVTQNRNLGSQSANGVDFTLLYQKETAWGTFTSITQATWLYNFQFPQGETALGLGLGSGNLVGFTTNPGASNEGYYEWKADTSLDWGWKGFDVVGTVHYIDGFDELDPNLVPRSVEYTIRLDLQVSYDFSSLIPVETNPVPGYSKDAKGVSTAQVASTSTMDHSVASRLLTGTVITVGCNNVFDDPPPFSSGEGGNAVGYPGFTYDATGRFVYVRLTKKF